jgi:cell wall-associated NlpC family hydrolase
MVHINKIIDRANELVGTNVIHQGRDVKVGIDCIGLLLECSRVAGYPVDSKNFEINDYSVNEYDRLRIALNYLYHESFDIRPGTIMLCKLKGTAHIGIKIFDDQMIHAGRGVIMKVGVAGKYWRACHGTYRFKGVLY